jgi:two-component system chemotaxis response regulator CheY
MAPVLRVLVVDDHESMRSILATLLRAYGFDEIHQSENGRDAIEALKTFRPDIIVTDFAMPYLDGIAFARQVRESDDDSLRLVPILMVSGHAHTTQILAARDAGVNEFLRKPVTGRNLAARIRRIIDEDRIFVRATSYIGPDRRRGAPRDYKGPKRRNDDATADTDANG